MAKKKLAKQPEVPLSNEERMRVEAARFEADSTELFTIYKALDRVLSRRPLKSVTGARDHLEYLQRCRDIAIRAWREVEEPKQVTPTLTLVEGGAKQPTSIVKPGTKWKSDLYETFGEALPPLEGSSPDERARLSKYYASNPDVFFARCFGVDRPNGELGDMVACDVEVITDEEFKRRLAALKRAS